MKHHYVNKIFKATMSCLTTDEKGRFERMEAAAKRIVSLAEDLLSSSQAGFSPGKVEEYNMKKRVDLRLSDLNFEIEQKKAKIKVAHHFSAKGPNKNESKFFKAL